ncbi:MAG: hypothetical protein EGP82_05405 [Odoribacter splanchnicus]|nr:hypothetical protein [Odoribacter splanchnicus]
MEKIAIVDYGAGEQGKSAAIKSVYKALSEGFEGVKIENYMDDGDVKAELLINGYRIGIESQGDPGSRVYASLKEFVQHNCDMIIVACRTKGDTIKEVQHLREDGYKVIWAQHMISKDLAFLQTRLNAMYAQNILAVVKMFMENRDKTVS